VRLQAYAVWDALEFLLNGFVFVLIGLQLPYVLAGIKGLGKLELIEYGLAFSAVLILLRMAWMFPASAAAWWVRTCIGHQNYERPKANQVFVIGWTGMRGVIALAAASSLPMKLADGSPFPQRNMILFLTFFVILMTVVVQGLSLPWVIRLLRLPRQDTGLCEEGRARHLMLQAAIDFLGERRNAAKGDDELHLYDDLLHQFEHRINSVDLCGPGEDESRKPDDSLSMEQLLLDTVRRQRDELNLLRENGRVGDTVHRTLERELDLSESRLGS
jgi:monovalent cation/hydrogen antiporter